MVKYVLYPTDDQRIMLDKTLKCCKDVHNEMLKRLTKTYEEIGNMKVRADFTEDKWRYLKGVDLSAIANEILGTCSSFFEYYKGLRTDKPELYIEENDCDMYSTINVTGKEIAITEDTISLPKIGVVKAELNNCVSENKRCHKISVSKDTDNLNNNDNVVYYAYVVYSNDDTRY